MKKLLLIALMLVASSAAHAINDTVWRMEIDAKDDGVWVGGRFSATHEVCRREVIRELNSTGWEIDRFRCVEVEMN